MTKCPFCHGAVNPDAEENYREVSSWVSGPKLDGPKLREQTGRVAHKHCVENLASGQAPDQPELFAELQGDPEATPMSGEAAICWPKAGEPILTDNPGRITKLTGPNSFHEALTNWTSCDAEARRGTGWGVCGFPLTAQGDCPNAGNHRS